MTSLPSGVVTFVFTDVEGSTRLLERDPHGLRAALARHHVLLSAVVERAGGGVFETVGDAVYAAFADPVAALGAAAAMQRAIGGTDWGTLGELRIRIAVHSGPVDAHADHYFGAPLFVCARIQSLAHGGQTLVSEVTRALVPASLPDGLRLRPLGRQRLRDLTDPIDVHQLDGPGLVDVFPVLRTGAVAAATSLPAALSTFVGRVAELRQLGDLVLAHRLVTVLGPGGAGKSRQALETARLLGSSFPEGIHLVELASVRDPYAVDVAVAAALGVRPFADQPPIDALIAHLRDRHVLLLLDNWEHLLDGAGMVADLLAAAPRLHVLATSREPLLLPGERRFPLEPLDPADAGARLFVERACQAVPTFAADDREWASIVELCRGLDGLPLAIELAAARVVALSPSQMVARLDRRLALATGRSGAVADRQRTLRGTIAWSVDLLGPEEREGFVRLGAFIGSFDPEAAAVVTGRDVDEALDLLVALVDRSLVVRRPEDDRGSPRFALLETIREFAAEALAADPAAEATAFSRHAAWIRSLTSRAAADLDGGHVSEGFAAVARQLPDIEAAITRSVACGDGDMACGIAADLELYWEGRGGRARAHSLLVLSLGASRGGLEQARALNVLGMLQVRLGDQPAALRTLDEARAVAEPLGTPGVHVLADACNNSGTASLIQGRREAARAWYERADETWARSTTPPCFHRTAVLTNRAFVVGATGDLTRAEDLQRRGLADAEAVGNALVIDVFLYNLGLVVRARGDARAALEVHRRAVAGAAELELVDNLLDDLEGVADDLLALDLHAAGARILGGCEAIRSRRDERPEWDANPDLEGRRRARLALGDAAWEAARAAGAALTLAELIDAALDEEPVSEGRAGSSRGARAGGV